MSRKEMELVSLLNERNQIPELETKTTETIKEHGITPFIRQDVQVTMTIEEFCLILKKFNPSIYHDFLCIDVPDKVDTMILNSPSGQFNFILNSQYLTIKDQYLTTLKKLLLNGPATFGISVVGNGDVPDFLKDAGLIFDRDIPVFASENEKVTYPVFKEETYNTINVTDPYETTIYVVNKNIPYHFFSRLPIIPEAFSYNISENKPRFFGISLEDFKEAWNKQEDGDEIEILKKLINTHMQGYIDISDNSIIVSGCASELIAIGMYYGFPTIPASIILTDKTLHVLGRNAYPHTISTKELNEVCSPYIILNTEGK